MKAISLFSGAGGDTVGLYNANINVVAYSENDKTAKQTHELNFQNCVLLGEKCNGDIKDITNDELDTYVNTIDVIFAGFPCQGYSNAGKKKVDDPRNSLFQEFVRVTERIKPKIIIGENVKGLTTKKTSDGDLYIDVIVQEFNRLGYIIDYKIMKTEYYGIPQKRERLIIIGVLPNVLKNNKILFPTELNTQVNLKNIIIFDMTGAIKIKKKVFDFSIIPSECILTDMNNDERENNPHPYLQSKVHSNSMSYQNKTYTTLFSFSKRDSPIHCEILDIRYPCKTIICTYNNQPRLFVPLRNKNGFYLRCLLPIELQQIQGFDKNYVFSGNTAKKIIQIGNAVPPPLITCVCNKLIECKTNNQCKINKSLRNIFNEFKNETHKQKIFKIIEKDVITKFETNDLYTKIVTKNGDTQKSEKMYINFIAEVLNDNEISFNRGGSQQPYDFQDVASNIGIYDMNIEVKKSDSYIIKCNDTCPSKKCYYIIILTKCKK